MRRTTASESRCLGKGICTRMPCTAGSAFSRSTISINSVCVIEAGRRMVSPFIPSSMHVRSLAPTYTALAASSPTRATVSPGVMPRALSAETRDATSTFTLSASAVPSMMLLFSADAAVPLPSKVYRPRFANEYHFDLPRILQFRFDAPCNFFGHRGHAHVIDVVGKNDDAHLASGLDREDLFHALVARRDLLEAFESLHVRLERLAPRTGSRSGDRVGRLDENGDLALVRHVVVMGGDAVHDERVLAVLGCHLHAKLNVRPLVLVGEYLADVVEQCAAACHGDV